MECELCGRVAECKPAMVDGVKMMLCPSCLKHGHGVRIVTPVHESRGSPVVGRIKKPVVKDVYKDMDKELVSDWNTRIRNAREKKGITREELGFRIGERTVTISKIENGELRPSDKMIEKLEKELNITLLEEISSVPSFSTGSRSSSGFTLGDFIKKED